MDAVTIRRYRLARQCEVIPRRAIDAYGIVQAMRAADALPEIHYVDAIDRPDEYWSRLDDETEIRVMVRADDDGPDVPEPWSREDDDAAYAMARTLGASRAVARDYVRAAFHSYDHAVAMEMDAGAAYVEVECRDIPSGAIGRDSLGWVGADDIAGSIVSNDMVGNALADLKDQRERLDYRRAFTPAAVKRTVNLMLAATLDTGDENGARALCSLLERILMDCGLYSGFRIGPGLENDSPVPCRGRRYF